MEIGSFKPRINGMLVLLLLILSSQIPGALDSTLRLGCVLTTWADYGAFWSWDEIPLDAKVHYCNGGNNQVIKKASS